jgi:hypothetical protein
MIDINKMLEEISQRTLENDKRLRNATGYMRWNEVTQLWEELNHESRN